MMKLEKPVMARSEDNHSEAVLELCVEEMRRLYDAIEKGMSSLRTKCLALLAGEIAIVPFIFSETSQNVSAFQLGQMPPYGVVFFFVGIGLLSFSFILLLYATSKSGRSHPPEESDIRYLSDRYQTRKDFLRKLVSDYDASINQLIGLINSRSRYSNWALYSLSTGILILLLLKYGGGATT